ncbi:MAG TPA: bifunctional pyr operon transcriptional regulator/uracil phosphoribosyltransferase PyrR [Nitrospiria bacterium]|nr:bifunctional pyr operon transcriptional regulator/uracil phosphoribosyltransferase PyrR [Nitrospiria bacterium]
MTITLYEKVICDRAGINRSLSRIAHEIIEKNKGTQNLALVGIRTCGVHLAQRLKKKIFEVEKVEIPTGTLDITLYRDDLGSKKAPPVLKTTEIPFDVNDKVVVLVDDVLFTGRTIRAALGSLLDYGRPRAVQLAVLIDRGHRELPIRADFVGKNLPTGKDEKVKVLLEEEGEDDRVVILHSRREDREKPA